MATRFGVSAYGLGPYGGAFLRKYPSLFTDKGYNRRPRRDLYYPPTRIK